MKIQSSGGVIFQGTFLFLMSVLSFITYVVSWHLDFPLEYWRTECPGYGMTMFFINIVFSIAVAMFNEHFLLQIINPLLDQRFDKKICHYCEKNLLEK